jgi:N utilization substance protein B
MKVSRRQAREVAMQLLYQYDLNPACDPSLNRDFIAERLQFPALEEFALRLVTGVRGNLEQIDSLLRTSAENWSLGRMAPVDRNILRLAVYELRFSEGVPPKVAINEALEICKKYSSPDAVAFVNGILDRIAGLRPRTAAASSTPQAPESASE